MSFFARVIARFRFHRDLSRSRRVADLPPRREILCQRHKREKGEDQ